MWYAFLVGLYDPFHGPVCQHTMLLSEPQAADMQLQVQTPTVLTFGSKSH